MKKLILANRFVYMKNGGICREYYSLREADSIAKVKKYFILKEGI